MRSLCLIDRRVGILYGIALSVWTVRDVLLPNQNLLLSWYPFCFFNVGTAYVFDDRSKAFFRRSFEETKLFAYPLILLDLLAV